MSDNGKENRRMNVLLEYLVRTTHATVEQWLDVFEKRSADVHDGEPETNAYAACVSLNKKRPNNVLVFERYERGLSSVRKHTERLAHAELIETMGSGKMTKYQSLPGLHFYDIPGYGWWSRPTPRPEGNTIFVVTVLRFPEEAMAQKYVEITADFNRYCWENEPDILIYSGGYATKDITRGDFLILAGDFISIMECTNGKALTKHSSSEEHATILPQKLEAAGVEVKLVYQELYRTSGRGFMNRDEKLAAPNCKL